MFNDWEFAHTLSQHNLDALPISVNYACTVYGKETKAYWISNAGIRSSSFLLTC